MVADVLSRLPWEKLQQTGTQIPSDDMPVALISMAEGERTLLEFDTAECTRFMCPVTAINHAEVHAQFPTADDARSHCRTAQI